MPTGYTSPLYEGEEISFEQFVLRCARAFGALITLRDEPLDKEIPEDFPPREDSYYERELPKRRERLEWLHGLTSEQAEANAEGEFERALTYWKETQEKYAAMRTRYLAMLKKVEAWQPPTEEHVPLKEFMVSQITDSIEHDCPGERNTLYGVPIRQNGQEWLESEIKETERMIEMAEEEIQKEKERAAGRSAWVRNLRESLQTEQPVSK